MEKGAPTLYLLDVTDLKEDLSSRLSEEDQARFRRYLKQEDRLLFLGGRLLIHRFLGKGKLSFASNGKPYVDGGPSFSLTHSYPFVALLVGEGKLGVDIESKQRLASSKLGEIFPSIETDSDHDLGEIWCVKEAIYKAKGTGYFDPKKPLLREEDGTYVCKGERYFVAKTEVDGYLLVAASTSELPTLPVHHCTKEDL